MGVCEPRIKVIVKFKIEEKKSEVGFGGQTGVESVGLGEGFGRCEPRIEGIVKRAERYYTNNNYKNNKKGGVEEGGACMNSQPSQLFKIK